MTRRTKRLRPLPALAAITGPALLVIGFAGSCARRAEPARSTERAGAHGALHYRLQSQVLPPRVTLGDRATWRLRADLSNVAAIGTLVRDGTDSSLDLVPETLPRIGTRGGAQSWSCSFRVSGYTLGRIALPRAVLPVRLGSSASPDSLEFPPDTLDVDSLTSALRGSAEPDRGPLPTELRPIDIAVAALLGALVLAAIVGMILVVRARRRSKLEETQAAAEPLPPEATFLRAIDDLRRDVEQLPRDEFYDRLSLAVRAYATAVTSVPALDRTTSELERELRARPGVAQSAVEELARVLRRSDLAKFARREDRLAEARAVLDEAAGLSGRLLASASAQTGAEAGTVPGAERAKRIGPGG